MSSHAQPKPARSPANRKGRRTQEERSQETRSKLLAATVELLIERGYSRLTVDDVSSRAGVTNGARAHHYATKLDLMAETFKHLQAPVHEASREAAARAATSTDPLRDFFEHSVSQFLTPNAVAFTELLMGARTDAALRGRISVQHDQILKPWTALLLARGVPVSEVQPLMTATIFFMRGIASDPLVDLQTPEVVNLLTFWRDKIFALVDTPPPLKGTEATLDR